MYMYVTYCDITCIYCTHTYTQCPRSKEEGYVGEILLGIKWSPVTDSNTGERSEGSNDGQLQVYIVEGAGMVDEETHKPFNAFIKW